MAKRKKTGGRTKGTPNKGNTEDKQKARQCFEDAGGFEEVFDLIKKVAKDSPKDAASLMMKAAEFFLPKQKAVEHKGDNAIGTLTVNFDSTNTVAPITSENELFDDD